MLPLTDGTSCRVEDYALAILRDTYGVTRGRVKSAGDYSYVVVTPRKGSASRAEVRLIDLLAAMCYEMPSLLTGEKWICSDHDHRNLTRANIVVEAVQCADETVESFPEPATVYLDTRDTEKQFDLLAAAIAGSKQFKPLSSLARSILRNKALAEEVLSEATLSICEQIRAGKFRGKTQGEFFAWVRSIVRRQCSQRLEGIVLNVCGDIEHDRAELRLIEKWRAEGRETDLAAQESYQEIC